MINTKSTVAIENVIMENLMLACDKYGYEFIITDTVSNSLFEIKDNKTGKSFYASMRFNSRYPINNIVSFDLAKDKAWTETVLKKNGFNVIPGDYFFVKSVPKGARYPGKEVVDSMDYAVGKFPLIVKPNKGSLGKNVDVVRDRHALLTQLLNISKDDYIALVQEVQNFPEYRIFVVNGNVEFAYRKKPQTLIGDGKRTVEELINDYNSGLDSKIALIKIDDDFIIDSLGDKGMNMQSVLPMGEQLIVRPNANITTGGEIIDYTEKLPEVTEIWAKKVADVMGLNVCGIDVFVKDGLSNPDDFMIIEVNGNPSLKGITMLGHQDKAIEIWGKVLKTYFNGC